MKLCLIVKQSPKKISKNREEQLKQLEKKEKNLKQI
jgi:hypothetical protein